MSEVSAQFVRALVERCLQPATYLNLCCIAHAFKHLVFLYEMQPKGWLLQEITSADMKVEEVTEECKGLNAPKDYERSRKIMKMLEDSFLNLLKRTKRRKEDDFSFLLGKFRESSGAVDSIRQFQDRLTTLIYDQAKTAFTPNILGNKVITL